MSAPTRAGWDPAVLDELVDEDRLVALAGGLVRAGGVNPPGDEGACASLLVRQATDLGLEASAVEVAPGRPNVVVRLPGGPGPGLLLLGHTDVVPVGTGWSGDPFGGEVRGGRLHGRGSADMKGGLAAALLAMAALRESGAELTGPVELAALVDEEETGIGIRRYVEDLDPDRFLGCVVAEPTDLQVVVAARGDSYVEVEVSGKAAHSGNPDDGANAVHGAARVVCELQRWHDELSELAHPLVGSPTWSVGLISGGQATSTVPALARVSADRRLMPGEDPDEVLEEVRRRLGTLGLAEAGLGLEVRMSMDMPGFETSLDDPFVIAVDEALAGAGGPGKPLGGWSAACDGGFVAQRTTRPVVVMGAGSIATQAHQIDESVEVAQLVTAARAYARTALALLTGAAASPVPTGG